MGLQKDLILLFLLSSFAAESTATSFTPTDNYLLDCGTNEASNHSDGRLFEPDSQSPLVSLSPPSNAVVISPTSAGLYKTARVFAAQSTYSFPIRRSGRHWLRLHFHASESLPYDLKSASFSVSADGFVLLSEFSVGVSSIVYNEYLIDAHEQLSLIFTPSDGSIAFVNAIEVVSVPDILFPSITRSALQTCYRINVGGQFLDSNNDSLSRVWVPDQPFIINAASARSVSIAPNSIKYGTNGTSPDVAPVWVYSTAQEMADANVGNQKFNVSWSFDVEPGFDYLVRLHFCDIVSKPSNTLVFDAYINSQSVLTSFDILSKTEQLKTAYFADFFVQAPSIHSNKILIQVGPPELSKFAPNAILNGLEILKLSDADDRLDKPNRDPASAFDNAHSSKKLKLLVLVVASCLGGLALMGSAVLACLVHLRRRRLLKDPPKKKPSPPTWLPLPTHVGNSETTKLSASHSLAASSRPSLNLGHAFTISELRDATKCFDEGLILGVGGFGKVYKGVLDNGLTVAVKRGNPRSRQGLAEFHAEIETLSKLRHRHLVSLIGYCQEQNEMVLVYEYMARGPLRKHIYTSENSKNDVEPLTWRQRLDVCIGAAKGLHYLHTGASETVIHRDVKTTNILLDEGLVAKVADFGLSKLGPTLDQTHVSTAVKGSFGYLDPEYFRRQQLTEKSDVYSFGVVLMEVLCARPAINPGLPREQVNIAEWAMRWQKRGQLERIIDPKLVGRVCKESLRKFGETAEKCLAEYRVDRPSMGDVLWNLEYALQLQESFERRGAHEAGGSTNGIRDLDEWVLARGERSACSSVVGGGRSDVDTSSGVFSQLIDPKGR
ncbi:putative receptor-like protein kinase [Acorus calamus]|uniref:Receptor-like protein kinase n=1 Tax=Acorus calamus TaxID=4465 RepID=A0AAV9CAM8_ACOCL|nr:putative receptor-like protein kinase [Acorus calamus]